MNIFILAICLIILAETTYLTITRSIKSSKKSGQRKVYVDTSALIDERTLAVAKTGFISADLVIPKSVTRELQILADGKDAEKRKRARYGLSTVSELERVEFFDTTILNDDELGRMLVDERLLTLAKENHGAILTCDYNLCKVAATEKIETLNVNDLALALNNKFHIGDILCIKITERGHNPDQGIGYTSDGTMVVIDNAAKLVGKDVDAEFIHFHQTQSGRMIFAKLSNSSNRSKNRKKTVSGRQPLSESAH